MILSSQVLLFRPAVPEPPEPVLTSDPAVLAVVEQCEQLAHLIGRLKQQSPSSNDAVHPRECVPPSVQEEIICWLGGLNLVSSSSFFIKSGLTNVHTHS